MAMRAARTGHRWSGLTGQRSITGRGRKIDAIWKGCPTVKRAAKKHNRKMLRRQDKTMSEERE